MMQVRKLGGIGLQLIGVTLLMNAGQGITGFVVAESLSVSVSGILGLTFLLGGLGLTMWQHRTYDSYEPAVRRAMGDSQYEPLPESDQRATLKAYRRQENKLEKTAHYRTRQEAKHIPLPAPYEIIRTERFEKAIQGHPRDRIERALRKLEEGRGNRKVLVGQLTKGTGLREIKTDATGRIYYREEGRTVTLVDYDSNKHSMRIKGQGKLARK